MFNLIDYETHHANMLLEKTSIDARLVNNFPMIAKCGRLFLYNHRKNIYLRTSMKECNTNMQKQKINPTGDK